MKKLIQRCFLVLLFGLLILGLSACKRKPTDFIGQESYQDPSSVLLYENIPDAGPSVLYHHLKDPQEFIRVADKPVWVFVYHSLSPVFRDLIPFSEQLTEAYRNHIYVLLLEVDACPGLEKAWGIRQLPYLALFQGGKVQYVTDRVERSTLFEAKQKMDQMASYRAALPPME